ncbi:MAG: hypothetical protein KGL59_01105 [Acidobacteriota bacterium]|nr:hypothetical protein [Acidobacteriota bacterium]
MTLAAFGLVELAGSIAQAQNPQLQERVAEIRQASAQNKQLLAQYTWQEQQTISIKGDVKKQAVYQVHLGPDGKPQKTQISPQQQSSNGGRDRGLRGRIQEKKIGDFEQYAKQVAALAQSYAQPEPGRLQQLYQQGNISLGSGGEPGLIRMVIHNYVKQGDTVTLVFNRAQKALQSMNVSSYLDNPQDAVTISGQYARIPGGPNHVDTMTVNGVSKQLTVTMQNSNYQKM